MGDYEPNASNIMGVGQAEEMGQKQANNFTSQVDMGQSLQQQIAKTQAMKDQLAKQMQDNHDAMVNHVGQSLYQLSSADEDNKKGPVWKMQRDETLKKMQSLGVQADPDVVDSYLKDPDNSGKFTSALAQVMDPKGDPHASAVALSTLHDNFGSMEEAVKAPDEMLTAHATAIKSANVATNTMQSRADKIRDQVKGINSKWDSTEQFTDNALNILSNKDLASTGPGQTMLQEAYTRAGSGGAIRSFTLQLGQENRSLSNKMSGALDKLQTGAKLQPDELVAMKQGLSLFSKNANKYRDNEASTYYQSAKNISSAAQSAGYDIKSNTMMPDDQFARLSAAEDSKNNPQALKPTSSSVQKGPSIPGYELGKNTAGDNLLKGFVSSGMSLSDINKRLIRVNRTKLSQDDYNQLKGNH